MTIFTRTAINLIKQVLNKSKDASVIADHSLLGSWTRDLELSETQRTFTTALLEELATFVPKDTDAQSKKELVALITKTHAAVESARKSKTQKIGELRKTLNGLTAHVESFYFILEQKRKEFNLIDLPDASDPFSILCAHAAHYLGEDIFCPAEGNILTEAVSKAVSSVPSVKVRDSKEACLLKNLILCKKNVDGLDKNGKDYQELRRTAVLRTIADIERENAQICKQSQAVSDLPVQVSMFAVFKVKTPPIKPSRGRLLDMIKSALTEIEERCPIEKEEAAAAVVVKKRGDDLSKTIQASFTKFGGISHAGAGAGGKAPEPKAKMDVAASAAKAQVVEAVASEPADDDIPEAVGTPPGTPPASPPAQARMSNLLAASAFRPVAPLPAAGDQHYEEEEEDAGLAADL